MLGAAANFDLIHRDLGASLSRTASQPTVERASQQYLKALEKVETIEDFLSNDKVYRFAMKAMGLEDMTYGKAFMRKVLTEGVAGKDSFANKLADTRYREFAETFNFAQYGKTALIFDKARQGVVDRYVRQTLEETAGASNEGTRLALYFERKAASITSAYSLLADPALLKVTQTALGLIPETGRANIDSQAALIESKLDIEDLREPRELRKFLTRFLVRYDAANSAASTSNPAVVLFSGGNIGMDSGLLLTLQTFRSKGL